MAEPTQYRTIGRYMLCDEIAAGGMASVHLGRLIGPVGFSRTVAIKRLHQTFARDPEFVSMFLDEARLAARIRHPNVVSVLDVVALDGELFLVMDYVQGESLSRLMRSLPPGERPPLRVVVAIMVAALYGLHAAHEARNQRGQPLGLVHRDVSPQNILVGADGIARIVDFGVAKAANRIQTTREGQLKGKISYMSPEQVGGEGVDRRTDIYASAVVLWEALCGRRLFEVDEPVAVVARIVEGNLPRVTSVVADVPAEVDAIVMRGLAMRRENRFETARDMALALERAVAPAPAADVGEWVERLVPAALARRASQLADMESQSNVLIASGSVARPAGDAEPEHEATQSAPKQSSARSDGLDPAEDSQLSMRSVSAPVDAPGASGSRRSRSRVVAGAVVFATLVAAAVMWSRFRHAPRASTVPPAAASALASAPPSAPAPVATPAPALPLASAADKSREAGVPVAPSASASAPRPATHAPTRARWYKKTRRAAPPKTSPPASKPATGIDFGDLNRN